jgi:hypothetical protein
MQLGTLNEKVSNEDELDTSEKSAKKKRQAGIVVGDLNVQFPDTLV